ncbi:MAG: hypothetical protein GW823_11125 [Bacteroidetes bacterium]|nr:hypothetical protein [Bacteroidota bacterium]
MTLIDWIGSIGVSLLLIAYLLNIKDIIEHNSLSYILLNIFGAFLACIASILLHYIPFVILEACWILVSIAKLVKLKKREIPLDL